MTLRNRHLIGLDAALYFTATLGFAVLWHLSWFSGAYTALNWPDPSEADVPLGALAVATQAVVLAIVLDWALAQRPGLSSILRVLGLAFVFLWTSHVIGDAAKCGFAPKSSFVAIETGYLAIQFVLYGVLVWLAHRSLDARLRGPRRRDA